MSASDSTGPKVEVTFDREKGLFQADFSVGEKKVLEVWAANREDALQASRILLLHELVKRGDLRETGKHDRCEGCEYEESVTRTLIP